MSHFCQQTVRHTFTALSLKNLSTVRLFQNIISNSQIIVIIFLGGTRTDLALASANSEFFCNHCTQRPSVPKVLLVLTDGKSSYSSTPAKDVAQPMKVYNVNNF